LYVSLITPLLFTYPLNQIDPEFTLTAPRRYEILPQAIRNKVWACLATRFNVEKKVVRSIIQLDREITQYGKVRRSGELMTGCHFVKKREDSRDASFVEFWPFIYMKFLISFLQYTLYVDRHARHRRKTPEFEEKIFFGQLNRILLLELLQMPQLALAEPATLILAVIQQVKATLRDGLYYYTLVLMRSSI
jgi:hypothetical protein